MSKRNLLTGTAMLAIGLQGIIVVPASATGTQAGTTITNNVTVEYQINGIDQDDATASVDVVVDRKVDLTVARTDNTATEVNPGETSVAVSFVVENTSNDTLDFDLSATQVTTGGTAGISGNDSFDIVEAVTPLAFYLDDGNGVFDGADTLVTHLDALAPDNPVVVHVVGATVPTGLATGEIAAVTLTATAKANDNGTALGTNLVEATVNSSGVDTIFADGAGATDGSRDAAFSDTDDFIVLAAALTATKTSKIVAGDFGTGTAIPGATIEYCISLSNASGGAAASGIAISDTLPGQVTYDSGYGVLVGGADCDNPGATAGSYNSGTGIVSGTIASLLAGTTQTLIFRATID